VNANTNARELRRTFGRFATGVTVVTYESADGLRGATMNSFTSVSMDPPLLLISVARSSRTCDAMAERNFSINVLRADQMDVAMHFAGRPREGTFIDWDPPAPNEPPSLSAAVAVLRCRPWRRYDGGDHVLQLGEVISSELRPGEPLVFSDGRFATVGLPLLDGPLVLSLEHPPVPAWTAAAHRTHHHIGSA
jgi:flavin reductase (DIM6/NTAB) family NADH-FMN oxidoreductase RutF